MGLPFELRVTDNGTPVEDPVTTRLTLEALLDLAGGPAPGPDRLTISNAYTLPIGAGFGVSGACALASALAANEALGLGLARQACVTAAHVGEVRARSGLGDVVAQAAGGFEIRVREGAPPHGEVLRIQAPPRPVLLVSFGPIRTGAFLTDPARVAPVNAAGRRCLEQLIASPSLPDAFRLGREFASALGLVSARAQSLLDAAGPGTWGTVAMLGDSLAFLDPPSTLAGAARASGAAFVEWTRVAPAGARIMAPGGTQSALDQE